MMEVKGQGEDKVSTEEAYWMGTLQEPLCCGCRKPLGSSGMSVNKAAGILSLPFQSKP